MRNSIIIIAYGFFLLFKICEAIILIILTNDLIKALGGWIAVLYVFIWFIYTVITVGLFDKRATEVGLPKPKFYIII